MSNEPKIMLISPDYPPPLIGGSLVYMNNLVSNSDLKISILTDKKQRLGNEKIKFLESHFITESINPSLPRLILMYLFLSARMFFNNKYDCVILNVSAIGNGLLAGLLSKLKVKTVIIAYAEELTVALYSSSLKGKVKKFFMKGYQKADMVISVSNFARRILIDEMFVECPIYVIPTPLHNEKIIQTISNKSSRRGILSVGRLIKRKGFDLLIKSYRDFHKQLPDSRLTIIGDGPEKKELESLISKYSLGSEVKIFSNVTGDFLTEQYQTHELFVLANHMLENGDCEGAPNVFIEAGAYGLPSIAGKEGGASDVVEDGVSGYLIDPKDINSLSSTIYNLMQDKKKLAIMGNNANLKVKKDHDKKIAGQKFKEYILQSLN
jgi:phosphatidylinositol alpha-1,6-mannosyltransferase